MVIFEKTIGVNSSTVITSKKGDTSSIPTNMLCTKKTYTSRASRVRCRKTLYTTITQKLLYIY